MSGRLIQRVLPIMLLVSAGCFRTTVTTGIPGAGQRHTEAWVPSYFMGLVPPPMTFGAKSCPEGVVSMTVRHSPGNVLVTLVTAGIYSPVEVQVTCFRDKMRM